MVVGINLTRLCQVRGLQTRSEFHLLVIDTCSELTLTLEDDINVIGSQQIALITDSCVAIIRQVPNQKLYFKNDERRGDSGREEDDIIAWTWKHFFMYPNQPDWLVRLPMTKTVRLGKLLTVYLEC